MIVSVVVQQHVDDAVSLADSRPGATRATHVRLSTLQQRDQRLAAHLEGLRLAGDDAQVFVRELRTHPTDGAVFVLALLALEKRDHVALDEIVALAQALPSTLGGLLCALGWMTPSRLQGVVVSLLSHHDPFRRMIGVAACAIHRVDPGLASRGFLRDVDAGVRGRAFRAAGELGLRDLVSLCAAAADADEDVEVQFWAAWAGVLLGDRQGALRGLTRHFETGGVHRLRAFELALQAMSPGAAQEWLKKLALDRVNRTWLVLGSGVAGQATYLPWVIRCMDDLATGRRAGQAFELITGVDLGDLALDRPCPFELNSGPSDDPEDERVEMDPDDGAPWPDPNRVQQWWRTNRDAFEEGIRYFCGRPVSASICRQVLASGNQWQRRLAAHHLSLLNPGTPLFNTGAPASRQRSQLAKM